MTRVVLVRSVCHCEKDDRTTRQSIVSRGDATGLVCSVTGSQWIATGYALAMTIIEEEEQSEFIFHSSPFKLHS